MSVRRLTYAQKSALLQIVRHGDAYPADGNHRRTYQSLEARGYAEDVGYGRYAITAPANTHCKGTCHEMPRIVFTYNGGR